MASRRKKQKDYIGGIIFLVLAGLLFYILVIKLFPMSFLSAFKN